MNHPVKLSCVKWKGITYFIDTDNKQIRKINDAETVIPFQDLPDELRKAIKIFHEKEGE